MRVSSGPGGPFLASLCDASAEMTRSSPWTGFFCTWWTGPVKLIDKQWKITIFWIGDTSSFMVVFFLVSSVSFRQYKSKIYGLTIWYSKKACESQHAKIEEVVYFLDTAETAWIFMCWNWALWNAAFPAVKSWWNRGMRLHGICDAWCFEHMEHQSHAGKKTGILGVAS